MAESKIKSHSRRTKSGTVRVKEGRRKSLGKKIAIVGGAGIGLVGLGLAGKKLTKEVIRQKAIRDFKPKSDEILNMLTMQGSTPNKPSLQKDIAWTMLDEAKYKKRTGSKRSNVRGFYE